MTEIRVELLGDGACRIAHPASGAEIGTDRPPEYGGQGRGFSSTDLVAAALGSCMATSMERVAERNGVDVRRLQVVVEKRLSQAPRRIASLDVTIRLPEPVDETTTLKLRRAAESCPVHHSLHPEVAVTIRFQVGA